MAPRVDRGHALKWLAPGVLIFLALVVTRLLEPGVAGINPLRPPPIEELDSPLEPDERQAPRLLEERNTVEIVVPWDMTLDEFVRLYQIDFPHVIRSIAEEEGLRSWPRQHKLRMGARYRIVLTPPAEDVP